MSFSAIRFFILDMDGTFYLGEQLLPGCSRIFTKLILKQDKDFCFLDNTLSHSSTFLCQN